MRWPAVVLAATVAALGCRRDPPRKVGQTPPPQQEATATETGTDGGDESDTGDPFTGEAAHVIPFADRTSMGYLLLFPPGTQKPEVPTREQLQQLIEQAFPERRRDGELDLLLTLIATEPHATDIAFSGELQPPSLDDTGTGTGTGTGETGEPTPRSDEELEELAAKAERQRRFDLIGLHIELIRLGIGDDATIPSAALSDPVLTRGLEPDERASLPGRAWALLLRADYRNEHAIRGLRLHQTLVRVAAEQLGALIHDPDTLETMNVESFTERRLRAAAGNVADQIAIVPFPDPHDDQLIRLSTRGMRRFGSVDVELAGLRRDGAELQRASDLLAGLALALAREAEVDPSGLAVQVPTEIEVDCELLHQTYSARDYDPPCFGSVAVHLVERPPEAHDPRDHVVARVVAPRARSDAPDYDHPQWVRGALRELSEPR